MLIKLIPFSQMQKRQLLLQSRQISQREHAQPCRSGFLKSITGSARDS